MISHREKRVVPFAADLIYSIVADVEQYPKFLPWVVACGCCRGAQTA